MTPTITLARRVMPNDQHGWQAISRWTSLLTGRVGGVVRLAVYLPEDAPPWLDGRWSRAPLQERIGHRLPNST
jgi:hypothetical protein